MFQNHLKKIGIRNYKNESLEAKVYPISEELSTYNFRYPNGKDQSEITFKSWGSNTNVKVKNVTKNKLVEVKVDEKSGCVSFEIEPNQNYNVFTEIE